MSLLSLICIYKSKSNIADKMSIIMWTNYVQVINSKQSIKVTYNTICTKEHIKEWEIELNACVFDTSNLVEMSWSIYQEANSNTNCVKLKVRNSNQKTKLIM